MCDLLLEVRGAVALLKACIEELLENWEEDVERLIKTLLEIPSALGTLPGAARFACVLDLYRRTKVIGWRVR